MMQRSSFGSFSPYGGMVQGFNPVSSFGSFSPYGGMVPSGFATARAPVSQAPFSQFQPTMSFGIPRSLGVPMSQSYAQPQSAFQAPSQMPLSFGMSPFQGRPGAATVR